MPPQFERNLFDILIAQLSIISACKDIGNVDLRQVDIMADNEAGFVEPPHLSLLIR